MLDAIVHAERRRLRVRVVICEMPPGKIGETDVQARIVWISDRLTPVEARCTEMHELAHIDLDHVDFTGDDEHDQPFEDAADEWAAVRLIPDVVLAHAREIAEGRRDNEEDILWDMAAHCGVDPNTMTARLRVADRRIPTQVVRLVRS